MNLIDFNKYENASSKFHATLGSRGGYITFTNTSQKDFTLSLESFLQSLRDIQKNFGNFKSHQSYDEKNWRDLGGKYFTDGSANALSTVQTKPFFATLSKIILWANDNKNHKINPEQEIDLSEDSVINAISKLNKLADKFKPIDNSSPFPVNKENQEKLNYDLFIESLKESNLLFPDKTISRFIASLCTKPFLILTGLSGSGKTKLAQSFIKWICQSDSQYKIVPVGADWTNREPLLGFPNALNKDEYVKPDNGVLDLMLTAHLNKDLPYFLLLDEMNLSHVERYFADFLSTMESKDHIHLHSSEENINGVPGKFSIPENLFIIGTVNIDETTYMFSPKVLDRANVIEFRISENEMSEFLSNQSPVNMSQLESKGASMSSGFLEQSQIKDFQTDKDVNDILVKFFIELQKSGAEFGYRSASEIFILLNQLTLTSTRLSPDERLDIAVMQKLLPKVHGSRRKLEAILTTLGKLCVKEEMDVKKEYFEGYHTADILNDSRVMFKLSLEKISRMYRNAVDHGFTSYAEA